MALTISRDTFYEEQIRALEQLEKAMVQRIDKLGEQPDLNNETVARLRYLLRHYRGVVDQSSRKL